MTTNPHEHAVWCSITLVYMELEDENWSMSFQKLQNLNSSPKPHGLWTYLK